MRRSVLLKTVTVAGLALVLPLAPQLTAPAHAATIVVSGFTDEAINAAIASANPGDAVSFPAGTYVVDEPLVLAAGVDLIGGAGQAVLQNPGTISMTSSSGSSVSDVTIDDLIFDNLNLRFTGSSDITLSAVVFRNGKINPALAQNPRYYQHYVNFENVTRPTVDGSMFLRSSVATLGRGVNLYKTVDAVVKDSFFGTTRTLEPDAPQGYFNTAINVSGWDETTPLGAKNTVIDGNVIRRMPDITPQPGIHPNNDGDVLEDHGIYAWGFDGLVVTNNKIDGWTRTGSGASLKIRNGRDALVRGNRFATSGVIMYTHLCHASNGPCSSGVEAGLKQYFQKLENVLIDRNRFDIPGGGTSAHGVSYRRAVVVDSHTSAACTPTTTETDIWVTNNRFVDTGVLHVTCASGPDFCQGANSGMSTFSGNVPGIVSGCALVPDSRQVAGLHRGDFDGDGDEDYARVSESNTWLVRLKTGATFVEADWGGAVYPYASTAGIGVHVADFDGNGYDDIAYRGYCGSTSNVCWRVHQSSGSGFVGAANDYGSALAQISPGTVTIDFGFKAGDFTGDGRADIAYRGACTSPAGACWKVLVSQASATFVDTGFGDGIWTDQPDDAVEYRFVVGDFNGDGLDDIAYPGKCDSSIVCLRVQRSTGTSFLVTPLVSNAYNGGARYFDVSPFGITAHFGLVVDDFDSDGRDDITYRGRCGSPGQPFWRTHWGSGTMPFTQTCTTTMP
jgi:hypothetical protein